MGLVSGESLWIFCIFGHCIINIIYCETGVSKADDGIFFMAWDDFLKYFDGVDVCCRSRDFDDINLDLYEDCGVFGPFGGGIFGM